MMINIREREHGSVRKRERDPRKDLLHSIIRKNTTSKDVVEEAGYGLSEVWDVKDYDKLLDYMSDIRKSSNPAQLTGDWINQSVNISLREGNQNILDFKPKHISIDHNVVTHPGIALTNKNITGQDMTRFLYIFSGTENSEIPTIHSNHIGGE